MVKGGYCINAPTNNDKEVDWKYKISNNKLREITNTLPIRTFWEHHHIKYLGHIYKKYGDITVYTSSKFMSLKKGYHHLPDLPHKSIHESCHFPCPRYGHNFLFSCFLNETKRKTEKESHSQASSTDEHMWRNSTQNEIQYKHNQWDKQHCWSVLQGALFLYVW